MCTDHFHIGEKIVKNQSKETKDIAEIRLAQF